MGNGALNPGQATSPPAPDQLAPGIKTLTLTNNSASTIYPILIDANTGQYTSLYYDPMDFHKQDYRAYVGYEQGGKNYLGLPPGATIVIQVPVVFWDSANLYFATDGSSMVPDDVSSIGVTYGGTGYGSNPGVEFMGGGGTGAAATATVSGGVITGVTVTNPGTGYTSPPPIQFTGGTSPATARAFLAPNPYNYIAPSVLTSTLQFDVSGSTLYTNPDGTKTQWIVSYTQPGLPQNTARSCSIVTRPTTAWQRTPPRSSPNSRSATPTWGLQWQRRPRIFQPPGQQRPDIRSH